MSQLPDLMKRANFSADGISYIGKAIYKSPELDFKTEADDTSFFAIEQVLGLNAMNTEVELFEYNPAALKLLNIVNGATVSLTFRGSYDTSDGVSVAFKEELDIQISKVSPGEKKVGKAKTTFTGQIHKWKLTVAGEQIYYIDQDHLIVDGVDQMLQHVINAGG